VTPDSGLFHLSAAVHVPAVGLFGSTRADQISKHYPLHKTIWPKDAPRTHKCKPPCMMFEWLGCDNQCRTQGCEILQKITTDAVLDAVQTLSRSRCACYNPPAQGGDGMLPKNATDVDGADIVRKGRAEGKLLTDS
jgi:hypothetical protein